MNMQRRAAGRAHLPEAQLSYISLCVRFVQIKKKNNVSHYTATQKMWHSKL